MSDLLHIPADRASVAVVLVENTALLGCTNVVQTDSGITVGKNWPRLSSGEDVLWLALSIWAETGVFPEVDGGSLDRRNQDGVSIARTVAKSLAGAR